jgi:hypothetical protein
VGFASALLASLISGLATEASSFGSADALGLGSGVLGGTVSGVMMKSFGIHALQFHIDSLEKYNF